MDIETAEDRLKLAKKVFRDFDGKLHGGLSLSTVAGYTIVDDENDRWLCLTDEYDATVEDVISDILDGCCDYDFEYVENIEALYERLCNNCEAIFCNIDQDESAIHGLDCTESELREIRELLCI